MARGRDHSNSRLIWNAQFTLLQRVRLCTHAGLYTCHAELCGATQLDAPSSTPQAESLACTWWLLGGSSCLHNQIASFMNVATSRRPCGPGRPWGLDPAGSCAGVGLCCMWINPYNIVQFQWRFNALDCVLRCYLPRRLCPCNTRLRMHLCRRGCGSAMVLACKCGAGLGRCLGRVDC